MIDLSQSMNGSKAEASQLDLERIARAIVARRMSVPAVFLLELHKPLVGLFHAGGLVVAPFLIPLVGMDLIEQMLRFLQSREGIERLAARVEELERERRDR